MLRDSWGRIVTVRPIPAITPAPGKRRHWGATESRAVIHPCCRRRVPCRCNAFAKTTVSLRTGHLAAAAPISDIVFNTAFTPHPVRPKRATVGREPVRRQRPIRAPRSASCTRPCLEQPRLHGVAVVGINGMTHRHTPERERSEHRNRCLRHRALHSCSTIPPGHQRDRSIAAGAFGTISMLSQMLRALCAATVSPRTIARIC